MKSIKTKMITNLGALILVICLGSGVISYFIANNALVSNVNTTLPQIATQTANSVEQKINGDLMVLESLASRADIANPNTPYEKKIETFKNEVTRLGYIKMGISNLNGDVTFTDGKSSNITDREYFKKAKSGLKTISDPIIGKSDGSVIVAYAIPIKFNNSIIRCPSMYCK